MIWFAFLWRLLDVKINLTDKSYNYQSAKTVILLKSRFMVSDSIRVNHNEKIIQVWSMKIKNIPSDSYVIVPSKPQARIKQVNQTQKNKKRYHKLLFNSWRSLRKRKKTHFIIKSVQICINLTNTLGWKNILEVWRAFKITIFPYGVKDTLIFCKLYFVTSGGDYLLKLMMGWCFLIPEVCNR